MMKKQPYLYRLSAGIATMFLSLAISQAQEFRNNAKAFEKPFELSADSLIKLGNVPSFEQIKASIANPILDKLKLQNVNKKTLSPPEIYKKALESTVVVGSAYLCPRCSKTHIMNATGYIIAEEGIVVTNHHVVEGYLGLEKENKPMGLFVRLSNGKTYPVKEVIADSKQNDLAILRLDSKDKFPALPLSKGAQVGDDAYVLGHPRGMYYFFTKGIVNSKFQEMGGDAQDRFYYDVMAISADYAAGASGGPVLDQYGNIIGTVSSTRTLQYSDPNKSVQMVLKTTIPVESLSRLLNKS